MGGTGSASAGRLQLLVTQHHDPFGRKYISANLVSFVGSITSRCSGKEPALLPRTHGWTCGLGIVNFDQ